MLYLRLVDVLLARWLDGSNMQVIFDECLLSKYHTGLVSTATTIIHICLSTH